MSYKMIELHVRRSNEKNNGSNQFEIDQFPENVQKDLSVSDTSSFYHEILNF